MQKRFIQAFAILTLIFTSGSMLAKENINHAGMGGLSVGSTDEGTFKQGAADCPAAEAKFELEINNVRTTILTGGDLWWDLSNARYEIPKVPEGSEDPSVHSLFAGAIWISGIDEGGNLKIAAQTYRQTGDDFWPGPINESGSIETATCRIFDRHFTVLGTEIDQVVTAFADNNFQEISDDLIPENVKNWPGRGNLTLEEQGYDVSQNLAPFFDYDGDGEYNPAKGDYPVIDDEPEVGEFAFADQMTFWVYNDVGNIHTETQGDAIGIQINALAFAFTTSDEINDMSFYRYNLENKSTSTLIETYMGQWVDPDLGCFEDDFVGCDVSRSLGIVYNCDANDQDCQTLGYGLEIPLLGVDYFEGPKDTAGNELGMSSFIYYENNFSARGNPVTAVHFRNYQTGFWIDGNPIEEGGNGYQQGTNPTSYMFPGDPTDNSEWSMCSAGVTCEDMRFLQNSGPFVLKPGAENNITVGVVWVRPPVGTYPCPSFESTLGIADDKAQALFDNGFKILDGPDAPTLDIREMSNQLIVKLVNSSNSNNSGESYDEVDPIIRALGGVAPNGNPITDSTYTFQGYLIYQLANAQVTAQELGDISKAKLVAQFDLKDNVESLVNYTFDPEVGANNAQLMVDAANTGIEHSILISEDQFAEGDPTLINHKTYYYAAVAYAYNNFQTYDPQNPGGGGQQAPYLQGRRNFKVYTAIPHISDPRNGGTVLNAEYGQGLPVTRVEGQGNGGFELQLNQESLDNILESTTHKAAEITYEAGLGPIDVKVVDPFAIKNADFELRMVIENPESLQVGVHEILPDTTEWELWDVTNAGAPTLITTSDKAIGSPNDQLINDYGISVNLGQPTIVYEERFQGNQPDGDVYGYITSSMEFEDPENPWLTLLQDQFTNSAVNWIRSGSHQITNSGAALYQIFDDAWVENNLTNEFIFHDELEEYENILDGRFAPYCLAANFYDPTNDFISVTHGPGFKWLNIGNHNAPRNNLDKLASVDIVLTSDRSKWSRCIVLETGEEFAFNERHPDLFGTSPCSTQTENIGSRKGQLRMTYSRDINGNIDLNDVGRSWFPGYAINLETGERLNIAFGEASNLPDQNGRDMIWNPSANQTTDLGEALFGGKHFIYVFNSLYDEGEADRDLLVQHYNETINCSFTGTLPIGIRPFYEQIIYTGIPMMSSEGLLSSMEDGLIPDNRLSMRINVERPYQQYGTTSSATDTLPVYRFSTQGMAPVEGDAATAESALDLINVVPNPYYAYSAYEVSQLDNRVKITNLPNECTVTIYSINGNKIRQFDRDIQSDISEGKPGDEINLDNSLDWDLTNFANIPVASGIYYIHVEAPGIGERTIKWFGALRPFDLDSF